MNVHVGVRAFISLLLLAPLQKNSKLDIHFLKNCYEASFFVIKNFDLI